MDAAALSSAFLRDVTANLAEASRDALITAYAAFAPRDHEDLVGAHLAPGTRLILADGSSPVPAGVEGFGRCLLQAIETMLERGHLAACVLSSDVPTLPTRLLVETAQHLLAPGDRAVLGACDDGGYYILGLNAAHARLFADIVWSTELVAEQTRERALEIGLEMIEIDTWYDVDDALALGSLLAETGGYRCSTTHHVVDRLGLRRSFSASVGEPA